MSRSNLEVFAEVVEAQALADSSLYVVTSDSRGSGKLAAFAGRMPERMIEVGIAEQNLVGVAAGLTAGGKRVYAVSPASFLTTRALEQIKHDVCYSDRAVVLIGISAGVSYGALGSTHHSLHDFAALRAFHNITIVAPADNNEARSALEAAHQQNSPFYLRFGKQALPDLPGNNPFVLGKGRAVRDGNDAAFVATGETVWRAYEAARLLEEEGYHISVISMHTIKPLDRELVAQTAGRVRALVTVEEHSEHGGLGDACARVLAQSGCSARFRGVAIPDEDTVTGSQDEILRWYGISPEGLADTMRNLLLEE